MLTKIKNFFKPMWRTIWIALAGQGIFIVSVITMSPLRMWEEPVVNYNLFYMTFLLIFFGFLFYRCCIEEVEAKSYVYGFFAALLAWPLLGEMSNLPVDKGLITQFSDMNIKGLGGYYFVIAGFLLLKILWLTNALKRSVCVFLLVFLSIWSFELYMDNYSSRVPIEMMPVVGNYVTIGAIIAALIVLFVSKRTQSMEVKTVMGCLLYIFFALVLMGSGQWKKPQVFYVKYEAAMIDSELRELSEEKEHINQLKTYMMEQGMFKGQDLKYMLDRKVVSDVDIRDLVAKGVLDGASFVYLYEKKLISKDEINVPVEKGLVKEKDVKVLRENGLVK